MTYLGLLSRGKFAEDIWEHSCLGCMENGCPGRFFAIVSEEEVANAMSQAGRCSKYGDHMQN